MKEKSKSLVYKSSLQFKSSLVLKEERLSKVKVMLEKGSKITTKSSNFGGVAHRATFLSVNLHWCDAHRRHSALGLRHDS